MCCGLEMQALENSRPLMRVSPLEAWQYSGQVISQVYACLEVH